MENSKAPIWKINGKYKNVRGKNITKENIIDILLENRGLKTGKEKKEFFNPPHPAGLQTGKIGINNKSLKDAIGRIKKALAKNEEIVIYGDYDADGICASAILWETLYSFSKNVRPYIPDRFEEGYGLNTDSISKLKTQNSKLKLIITVDNGITAHEAVKKANELGIDVIICDHHRKEKTLPQAYAILHTDKICGTGVAWILAREIYYEMKNKKNEKQDNKVSGKNNRLYGSGLDLCAIGTIADQMPLLGENRSFAYFGLKELNRTTRPGLLALFKESGIRISGKVSPKSGIIGTYEVNFVIAPRLNAMGRIGHAIESLRLLCIRNSQKAKELAAILGRTNKERQKIVDDVVLHTRKNVDKNNPVGVILIAHESYHEGVIGLAASKLVEEFWRPAIVLSKGEKVSKASARSIPGFNIIESIKNLDHLIVSGGGHPMAAGFSIETEKIGIFTKKLQKLAASLLTDEILARKLTIDTEIEFENLDWELAMEIEKFEPTGISNPAPVFATRKVNIVDAHSVGAEGKHLKLVLEKNGFIYNAIAFGKGGLFTMLTPDRKIDIAYNLIRDNWNGNKNLQLKIKDIKMD